MYMVMWKFGVFQKQVLINDEKLSDVCGLVIIVLLDTVEVFPFP